MRVTGGTLKNRRLKTPKGTTTRPTSEKLRQTVFNILQGKVEGSRCLDLFAGSGAIGIEALSRGAKQAVFIEKDRLALKILRDNLTRLQLTHASIVLSGDLFLLSKQLHGLSFDIIYVDPPYAQGLQEKALHWIDTLNLLDKTGVLFLEEGAHQHIPLSSVNTLALKNKRKMGSSFLSQFEYQRDQFSCVL